MRIALAQLGQVVAPFPLETDAGNVSLKAVDDALYIVKAVGVESADVCFYFGVVQAEGGHTGVAVAAYGAFCSPCTSGVWGVGVGLILIHYHVDGDVFCGIEVDEAAEHVSVCLKIAWVLYHVVLHGKPAWEDTFLLSCLHYFGFVYLSYAFE